MTQTSEGAQQVLREDAIRQRVRDTRNTTYKKNPDAGELENRVDAYGRAVFAAKNNYEKDDGEKARASRVASAHRLQEDELQVMAARRAYGKAAAETIEDEVYYRRLVEEVQETDPQTNQTRKWSEVRDLAGFVVLNETLSAHKGFKWKEGEVKWSGDYNWPEMDVSEFEERCVAAVLELAENIYRQRHPQAQQPQTQSRSEQISQRGHELADERTRREQAEKEGTLGGHYWGYSKEVVDYVLNDDELLRPEQKAEIKNKIKTKRITGSIYFDGTVSPTTAKDFKNAYYNEDVRKIIWDMNAPKRKQTLKVVAAGAATGATLATLGALAPGGSLPFDLASVQWTWKALLTAFGIGAGEGYLIDKFYGWYEGRGAERRVAVDASANGGTHTQQAEGESPADDTEAEALAERTRRALEQL